MSHNVDQYLHGLNLCLGASDNAIAQCQAVAGVELPPEYVQFVKRSNGAEGFVGESSYLMLWPVEELLEMNEAYEIKEYAPGLLLFGSDGGGEAYAFDLRYMHKPIVRVPFVGLSIDDIVHVGDTFSAFLKALSEVED